MYRSESEHWKLSSGHAIKQQVAEQEMLSLQSKLNSDSINVSSWIKNI